MDEDAARRIQGAYNYMKETDHLSKIKPETKTEAASLKLRQQGNDYYLRDQDYTNALESYNKSLCFAPVGSEAVAIVYGNRSAVYLKAGFFKFCLENIDMAEQSNCPEFLKSKLSKRREECQELMKTKKDAMDSHKKSSIPTPTNGAYPKIPGASKSIKLRQNEQLGCHLVTTSDFNPGDVVIAEKSFYKVLFPQNGYKYCINCLDHNYFNLKPCTKSTAAMFCSETCRIEAWESFLKYCYPILLHLGELYLPLRIVLNALKIFKSFEGIQNYIKTSPFKKGSAFELDYNNLTEEQKFGVTYTFETVKERRTLEDLMNRSINCASIWNLLKENKSFRENFSNKEEEDIFLNLFFHFYLVSSINSFGTSVVLDESNSELGTYEPHQIGSAIYPFGSYLNHSCVPNLRNTHVDCTNLMVVVKPIKAGEELRYCYGPQYIFHTTFDRQMRLSRQHWFECSCAGCQVPSWLEGRSFNLDNSSRGLSIDPKEIYKYQRSTEKNVEKIFKKAKDYLIKYHKNLPNVWILNSVDILIDCIQVKYSCEPLELVLKPKIN